MSDFLGRLEGELVAAARREAGATPRRRARRLRRPAPVAFVAGAACAALLALLLVRAPEPRVDRPGPVGAAGQLAGTWRGGQATLELTADGWRLRAPGTHLYGGLTVREGRVLLRPAFDPSEQRLAGGGSARERRVCDTRTGVYAATVARGRLTLRALDDPCGVRAALATATAWRGGAP